MGVFSSVKIPKTQSLRALRGPPALSEPDIPVVLRLDTEGMPVPWLTSNILCPVTQQEQL